MLFSFLPVRTLGFRFLIQADFVLSANREDVVRDNAWNQWICSIIPVSFVAAIQGFLNDACFRHSWFLFLPRAGEVLDPQFNDTVVNKIYDLLSSTPCCIAANNKPHKLDELLLPDKKLSFLADKLLPDECKFQWIHPESWLSIQKSECVEAVCRLGAHTFGIRHLLICLDIDRFLDLSNEDIFLSLLIYLKSWVETNLPELLQWGQALAESELDDAKRANLKLWWQIMDKITWLTETRPAEGSRDGQIHFTTEHNNSLPKTLRGLLLRQDIGTHWQMSPVFLENCCRLVNLTPLASMHELFRQASQVGQFTSKEHHAVHLENVAYLFSKIDICNMQERAQLVETYRDKLVLRASEPYANSYFYGRRLYICSPVLDKLFTSKQNRCVDRIDQHDEECTAYSYNEFLEFHGDNAHSCWLEAIPASQPLFIHPQYLDMFDGKVPQILIDLNISPVPKLILSDLRPRETHQDGYTRWCDWILSPEFNSLIDGEDMLLRQSLLQILDQYWDVYCNTKVCQQIIGANKNVIHSQQQHLESAFVQNLREMRVPTTIGIHKLCETFHKIDGSAILDMLDEAILYLEVQFKTDA